MPGDDITGLSATALAGHLQARDLSCREVTEAFLRRIERHDPALNAFCTLCAEQALDRARALDRAHDSDDRPGQSLYGLPIALKDLTPTAGIRTTRGSRLFENWIPPRDAELVRRLKAQGAVVLGKTNTPEFGHKAETDNQLFGPTRNPWNTGRIAGGSSGGSAAAVAAGLVPFAEGSDGAGSIRIPASLCGVFGFKPTFGQVPDVAESFFSHAPYFHNGPLARSVEDGALLYRAMAAAGRETMFTVPPGTGAGAERPVSELTVVFSPDLGAFPVSPEVAKAAQGAAAAFEELGARVETPEIAFPDGLEAAFLTFWQAKMAGLYGALSETELACLEPVVQGLIAEGCRLSPVEIGRATQLRDRLWQAVQGLFDRADLLICPTTAIPAYRIGAGPPAEIAGRPVSALLGWFLTYPFNLTGHPAASVPCGQDAEGLPLGVQIVGRRFADDLVLAAARAFEAARPWARFAPVNA